MLHHKKIREAIESARKHADRAATSPPAATRRAAANSRLFLDRAAEALDEGDEWTANSLLCFATGILFDVMCIKHDDAWWLRAPQPEGVIQRVG